MYITVLELLENQVGEETLEKISLHWSNPTRTNLWIKAGPRMPRLLILVEIIITIVIITIPKYRCGGYNTYFWVIKIIFLNESLNRITNN